MIKLEVHPKVLMSLNQAFPKPNMAATKALNKYVQVLEKLLFEGKRSINPVLPLSS